MKPDVSGPRAFLVLGPESSGTRLMTQILINAGCAGSAEHEQPFDDENYDLYQHDSIVWRRSVPHNRKPLDLPGMVSRLHYAGFLGRDIRAIVMTRDLHCMVQSQVRDFQHAPSEHVSESRIRESYKSIFSQTANSGLWFVVVPYESLVLGSQRTVLQSLGLEIPESLIQIRNENQKYYSNSIEVTVL